MKLHRIRLTVVTSALVEADPRDTMRLLRWCKRHAKPLSSADVTLQLYGFPVMAVPQLLQDILSSLREVGVDDARGIAVAHTQSLVGFRKPVCIVYVPDND